MMLNLLIFITVPSYNFVWSNEDIDDGHFRRYTIKELERKMKDKFTIVYSSYFFSYLPIPIFIKRTLPSLFSSKKRSFRKENEDHKSGIFTKIIESINLFELNRFSLKKKIRFGSSIVIVAKKNKLKE